MVETLEGKIKDLKITVSKDLVITYGLKANLEKNNAFLDWIIEEKNLGEQILENPTDRGYPLNFLVDASFIYQIFDNPNNGVTTFKNLQRFISEDSSAKKWRNRIASRRNHPAYKKLPSYALRPTYRELAILVAGYSKLDCQSSDFGFKKRNHTEIELEEEWEEPIEEYTKLRDSTTSAFTAQPQKKLDFEIQKIKKLPGVDIYLSEPGTVNQLQEEWTKRINEIVDKMPEDMASIVEPHVMGLGNRIVRLTCISNNYRIKSATDLFLMTYTDLLQSAK